MTDIEIIDNIQKILHNENEHLIVGITPKVIKVSINNFNKLINAQEKTEAVLSFLEENNIVFQENGHGIIILR
jgi:hypothetical protein